MASPDPLQSQSAEIAGRRLRDAMARFPTGVTVITAQTEAGPAGLTANAVSSLSLDPPLMLACVDRDSRTLRSLEAAGHFGVNVLGAEAADLAVAFGRKLPMGEKWREVGWSDNAGIPALDGAIVWIGCELQDVISGGDHVIVTGRVVAITERPGNPLLFHNGTYRPLADPE